MRAPASLDGTKTHSDHGATSAANWTGATLCEGVGTAVRDQMNDSSMGGPRPGERAPQKH